MAGVPAKPWLCGERTSDEVAEPYRLRRGEGYASREDESIVPEHNFCVLRGSGQRPNKHETGGFRVNEIRLFSQSGYRFALLAAFLPRVLRPRRKKNKRPTRFGCPLIFCQVATIVLKSSCAGGGVQVMASAQPEWLHGPFHSLFRRMRSAEQSGISHGSLSQLQAFCARRQCSGSTLRFPNVPAHPYPHR